LGAGLVVPGRGDSWARKPLPFCWAVLTSSAATVAKPLASQAVGVAAAMYRLAFQFRPDRIKQQPLISIEHDEVEFLVAHVAQRFESQLLGLFTGERASLFLSLVAVEHAAGRFDQAERQRLGIFL